MTTRRYDRRMTCPSCRQDAFTRLRRWYLGRTTCWWCDFCYLIIPTVTPVVTWRTKPVTG